MDFSKPSHGLVTPYRPAKHAAPDEDDVPAGADWFAWDLTIGPADAGGRSAPNPMSVQAPGIDTGTSLAAQLNWSVLGGSDHQQVEIKVGEAVIRVDLEMAALIQLLNRAGIATATSCIGTEKTWGYVMIVGFESAQRFYQIWSRYLAPLGHALPKLELDGRNSGWREGIRSEYGFVQSVPFDSEGLTYTVVWREHREDMVRIMPELLWALRCHLRAARCTTVTRATLAPATDTKVSLRVRE